jgi:hypothetical protein
MVAVWIAGLARFFLRERVVARAPPRGDFFFAGI